MFEGNINESYKGRRYRERHEILLRLAKSQHSERGKFTKFYRQHLESPEWKAKRELVLKRCGGVCEGCGSASASEVHHVTYKHLGNEFLFELLGLCSACHDRLHADKDDEAAFDPETVGDLSTWESQFDNKIFS
jgi:5-methylcytosine-specific restriction endonuclease McrA